VNNNMKACIVSGKRRRKRNSINHEEFALANYDGPLYHARELTKDHHPDREDERSRVESAGGYVLEWAGVYRVNGELALSRAIGDIPYKRLTCNLLTFSPSLSHLAASPVLFMYYSLLVEKSVYNKITRG